MIAASAKPSAPARVFVVEDELMIRMLLEDMLAELGFEVAAATGRIDEAVAAAGSVDADMAILDVNMHGQSIQPVADALAARRLPFVFATGYDERGIPPVHRGRPVLQKPFQIENLRRALTAACSLTKHPNQTP